MIPDATRETLVHHATSGGEAAVISAFHRAFLFAAAVAALGAFAASRIPPMRLWPPRVKKVEKR
jgi:hypothetical protein